MVRPQTQLVRAPTECYRLTVVAPLVDGLLTIRAGAGCYQRRYFLDLIGGAANERRDVMVGNECYTSLEADFS